jgi:hypothetical protein
MGFAPAHAVNRPLAGKAGHKVVLRLLVMLHGVEVNYHLDMIRRLGILQGRTLQT